jgi:hypothetical protein
MSGYFDGRAGFSYSEKYRTLMNCIFKMSKMEPVIDENLIPSIPHIMVTAAIIGHSKGISEPLEKTPNDIFIGGFDALLHGQRLDFWVAMIVWLNESGDEKTELFKPEYDVELCKKFNMLAMGGLSYLYEKQFNSGGTDETGISLFKEETRKAFMALNK